MAEHNLLTGAQLHEPKGVATAAADTVYVANGAGSGVWTGVQNATGSAVAGSVAVADGAGAGNFIRYQGWSQYQDSRITVGTPSQTLATGVRTKWINNGGAVTLEKAPSDATVPMWNTTTNKHIPIAPFDLYHLRISFEVANYAGASPDLEIELDIGGGIGVIFDRDVSLKKGGAAQAVSAAFPVYSGDTYLANGGEFYLTYTGTGTCTVYKSSLLIVRESKNYV